MFDFVLKFPIESAKSAALIVWFIEREAVVSQGTKQAWDWEIASALRINFARSARNLSKSSQISTLSLLLSPLLFYSILFILISSPLEPFYLPFASHRKFNGFMNEVEKPNCFWEGKKKEEGIFWISEKWKPQAGRVWRHVRRHATAYYRNLGMKVRILKI